MTKITVDKAAMQQVLEALTEFTGSMTVGQRYTNAGQMAIDVLPALRAALAKPAVEPGKLDNTTQRKAMNVRNSIGLMKNEDAQNNYSNHAVAIEVLETYLSMAESVVEPVAEITGIDEFGPMLGWYTHWAQFPIGAKLYATNVRKPSQMLTEVRAMFAPQRTPAEPAPEPDDQLHCDICGDVTDNPWHFSTLQDRHKHACDQCWESLKESDTVCKSLAEPAAEQCGYDETTGNCTKNPCCYTSPPPPAEVPLLTEDEIEREWQFLHDEEGNPPDQHDFARAIEQAVRQNAGLK